MSPSTVRLNAQPVNDPRVSKIARDLAPTLLEIQRERRLVNARFDCREHRAVGARVLREYGSVAGYKSRDPNKDVSLNALANALQQAGVAVSDTTLQRQVTAYLTELDLPRSISALNELSTTHLWLLATEPNKRRRDRLARHTVRHKWSTRVLEEALKTASAEKTQTHAAAGRRTSRNAWSDVRVREALLPVIAPLRAALADAPLAARRAAIGHIARELRVTLR